MFGPRAHLSSILLAYPASELDRMRSTRFRFVSRFLYFLSACLSPKPFVLLHHFSFLRCWIDSHGVSFSSTCFPALLFLLSNHISICTSSVPGASLTGVRGYIVWCFYMIVSGLLFRLMHCEFYPFLSPRLCRSYR